MTAMTRIPDVNWRNRMAAILGLAALVANVIAQTIFPLSWLPSGNIFFILSAICLGPLGAFVSCGIGALPYGLLTGSYGESLRVLALAMTIAYAAKLRPQIPGFMVTLGLWITVFAPGILLLNNLGVISTPWSGERMLLLGLSEVALTLIAGAILLNNTVWCFFTRTPRQIPLATFLIYSISLVAFTSTLGSYIITQSLTGITWRTWQLAADEQLQWFLMFFFAVFVIPVLSAERIAAIIAGNYREVFGQNPLPHTQTNDGFSGLSSDHWRRRESEWDLHPQLFSLSRSNQGTTQSMNDAILALSEHGIVQFANRQFLQLMHISEGEILGKDISALGIDAQASTAFRKAVKDTLRRGGLVSELKLNTLPNRLVFLEIKAQLSEEHNHTTPRAVILTIRDITERRTIEAHLLESQKVGSLGQMVTGIAHEFNNVLTSIAANAGVAKKSPDKTARALDNITDCTNKAGILVNQLLDYANNAPGALKAENLPMLIDTKLDLLRTVVDEKCGLRFEAPTTPVSVFADSNLLIQAITNLVINARESYDRPGEIVISLDTENIDEVVSNLHIGARPGNFARVRVKDRGVGMTPEVLRHAFDPLFSTKQIGGHTGLGLSIVYAIARAHDGFLTAESSPGTGTTVSLYLPLNEECEVSARASGKYSKPTSDKSTSEVSYEKSQILIVEDEPTVRELVSSMLDTLGYKVQTCGNGEEALALCQTSKFDLILTDLVMPKMSAEELISKIKSCRNPTKTLVMTGYGHIFPSKDIPVIQKPFDMEGLASAVRNALA